MNTSFDAQAVNVIPLPAPARVVWETLREIRTSFPGWYIWRSSWSASWNAHREGQEPYFGPVPEGAPVFMVSASSSAQLVALLERQTLGDMTREFPGWQIRRTDLGSWYALTRSRYGIRLVQSQAPTPLIETMRAMARHPQHDGGTRPKFTS